jgi:hypothetical protein
MVCYMLGTGLGPLETVIDKLWLPTLMELGITGVFTSLPINPEYW